MARPSTDHLAKPAVRDSLMPGPGQGFGVTFAQMFRKVTTEQYPFEPKVTKPRYHGRHVLNRHPDGLEKCVGCELCAWACPADAIYVEGGDNTEEARYSPGERYGAVYQINYLRCIFCGLCIEACPTRSLTMSNDFELADDNRQDLIYTKEQLHGAAAARHGAAAAPHAPGRRREGLLPAGARHACRRPSRRRPPEPPRRSHGLGSRRVNEVASAPGRRSPSGSSARSRWPAPWAWCSAATPCTRRCGWSLRCCALGVFYVIQEAPFLGAVQIIVYTGAIMILFLFVLMLVGRDSSDSRGRDAARAADRRDRARPRLRRPGRRGHRPGDRGPRRRSAWPRRSAEGNIPAIAELLFTEYLLAFEVTSAC